MSDKLQVPDSIREYSKLEQDLLELFAKEYVKCYDPELAAMAMGYSESMAASCGQKFLRDPLGQRFINNLEMSKQTRSVVDDDDDLSEVSEHEQWQKRIRAKLMREACDRGRGSSHSARVTALGILARSHGMLDQGFQIGKNPNDKDGADEGGVLIVESVSTESEWEAKAIEHSKVLKDR